MPRERLELFPTSTPAARHGTESDGGNRNSTTTDVRFFSEAYTMRQPLADEDGSRSSSRRDGKGRLTGRPGSRYKRYRRLAEFREDGANLKYFLKAAATLIGVECDALVEAVFAAEEKIRKWAEERRKETAEAEAPNSHGANMEKRNLDMEDESEE